jgi:hypothetical protein
VRFNHWPQRCKLASVLTGTGSQDKARQDNANHHYTGHNSSAHARVPCSTLPCSAPLSPSDLMRSNNTTRTHKRRTTHSSAHARLPYFDSARLYSNFSHFPPPARKEITARGRERPSAQPSPPADANRPSQPHAVASHRRWRNHHHPAPQHRPRNRIRGRAEGRGSVACALRRPARPSSTMSLLPWVLRRRGAVHNHMFFLS